MTLLNHHGIVTALGLIILRCDSQDRSDRTDLAPLQLPLDAAWEQLVPWALTPWDVRMSSPGQFAPGPTVRVEPTSMAVAGEAGEELPKLFWIQQPERRP